jgi:hypothetical protein
MLPATNGFKTSDFIIPPRNRRIEDGGFKALGSRCFPLGDFVEKWQK